MPGDDSGFYDDFGQFIEPPGTRLNSPQPNFNIATPRGGPLISTPSTYANPTPYDPFYGGGSGFATPQGGQLTPYSNTGTPAPGIRTVPNTPSGQSLTVRPDTSPRQPGWTPRSIFPGGPVLSAVGALANAPNTDQGVYNQANAFNDWFSSTRGGQLLNKATGAVEPQWGPATQTQTQTQPQQTTKTPVIAPPIDPPPPFGQAPPNPNYLPPFNRGPIPPYLSHPGARAPSIQQRPGDVAPPAPSIVDLRPQPPRGEYFATTGNARTPVWQPGGFTSPPAPHFQTPLTPMFGPGQWIGGQPQQQQQQQQQAPSAGRSSGMSGYNVNEIFNNLPNDAFNQQQPAAAGIMAHQRPRFDPFGQFGMGP
jgi:hypothetical protein